MRRIYLVATLLVGFAYCGTAWALYGAATEKLKAGEDAPRFTAQLLEGGDFDLGPLLGQKAVVIDFWSIYCVSCVQQMPRLSALADQYADQVSVVGVNLDSFGTKRVVQFVKGLGFRIPYPIVIDKERQAAARYSVTELPTTVLIDRRGNVLYYHVGYVPGDEAEIEENIRKAIAMP